MKQLMVHAERIVRPVRAMEGRKLRMRRELLSHLQSAVAEERAKGLDETAAIERAVERLGDPIELTRQLQSGVPWAERVMLARFPAPKKIHRMDEVKQRCLYWVGGIAMGQMAMLWVMGVLLTIGPACAAVPMRDALNHGGMAIVHPVLFFVGMMVLLEVILVLSWRFVVAEASPRGRPALRGTIRRGGMLVMLQIALMIGVCAMALDRPPMAEEWVGDVGVTCALLMGSALVARRIALWRQSYDEWMALDIAG